MAKYIAHSSIDERGKISGGVVGDQTKKECCIRTWYDKPFGHVLRIEDEKIRVQFANNMIDCANNDNIGYDQGGRNTVLTQAEKVNFDFTAIKTPCESDCSSIITTCILGAIFKLMGKDAYLEAKKVLVTSGNCCTTRTLESQLLKLTMFKVSVYTSSDYTRSTKNAVYGDIYNKEGSHVVAYIDDGNKKSTTTPNTKKIKAGDKFTLKDTPIYSSKSGNTIGKRSGVFYAWEDEPTKCGRIKMTNAKNRVGVSGQVSFFVEVSSLK